MSSVSIKMVGNGTNSIQSLSVQMVNEINAELVAQSIKNLGNASVALLSFEKYYMRTGSYAGLTVMLTEDGGRQTADIIGFGGGGGLFNVSWGANSNFAEMAQTILNRHGFRTVESDF